MGRFKDLHQAKRAAFESELQLFESKSFIYVHCN